MSFKFFFNCCCLEFLLTGVNDINGLTVPVLLSPPTLYSDFIAVVVVLWLNQNLSLPPSQLVPSQALESCASLKFWASQSVGFFKGDGFCSWLCSFEDYCNQFALTKSERLKEVASLLRDDACTWHQDMPLEFWEEWKVEAINSSLAMSPILATSLIK
ncbi:hypothetical protein DSO57_1022897 [Entomophthora muscae]|uniref:Uncharacterized protein n=1 Tax=Entomophthora muscae TaxID=34485 RepID=A0ACC2U1D1_9FUNG|nr:hypothetical protein DSO57_1022897 [Entomophthora muscae]